MKRVLVVFIAVVAFILFCGCGETNTDSSAITDVSHSSHSDVLATPNDAATNDAQPRVDADQGILAYAVGSSGPFGVGYRTFPYAYKPSGFAEERTIDIHIWYPTTQTAGEHPVYESVFPDEVSLLDAAPAPPVSSSGYPVHVHSHGHLGFAATSANLMQYFASHGWVAVAPDHTGNTLTDNIDPRPLSIYVLRSLDITASLDAMAELPKSAPLSGQLQLDSVVLSGHSFGVHTCWASAGATFDMETVTQKCTDPDGVADPYCSDEVLKAMGAGVADSRIAASIPMAGSLNRSFWGADGHASVTTPMLAMSGSEDPVGAKEQFETVSGVDLTWIDLVGGCHQTFGLGLCDTLDPEEGFRIVNTYALAFSRAHILADTTPEVVSILEGTEVVSDKVTFKRKQQ